MVGQIICNSFFLLPFLSTHGSIYLFADWVILDTGLRDMQSDQVNIVMLQWNYNIKQFKQFMKQPLIHFSSNDQLYLSFDLPTATTPPPSSSSSSSSWKRTNQMATNGAKPWLNSSVSETVAETPLPSLPFLIFSLDARHPSWSRLAMAITLSFSIIGTPPSLVTERKKEKYFSSAERGGDQQTLKIIIHQSASQGAATERAMMGSIGPSWAWEQRSFFFFLPLSRDSVKFIIRMLGVVLNVHQGKEGSSLQRTRGLQQRTHEIAKIDEASDHFLSQPASRGIDVSLGGKRVHRSPWVLCISRGRKKSVSSIGGGSCFSSTPTSHTTPHSPRCVLMIFDGSSHFKN
jgi:hypothetical protein